MNKSAQDWFDEGIELMRDEKYSEAKECFKKVIEIDDRYEMAWFHLGFCNSNLYYPDKATKCYRKAVNQDPKNYEAWYNLDNIYLEDRRDPFYDDPWEDDDDDEGLQEISLSSAWAEEFLKVAEEFDKAIVDLTKDYNIEIDI